MGIEGGSLPKDNVVAVGALDDTGHDALVARDFVEMHVPALLKLPLGESILFDGPSELRPLFVVGHLDGPAPAHGNDIGVNPKPPQAVQELDVSPEVELEARSLLLAGAQGRHGLPKSIKWRIGGAQVHRGSTDATPVPVVLEGRLLTPGFDGDSRISGRRRIEPHEYGDPFALGLLVVPGGDGGQVADEFCLRIIFASDRDAKENASNTIECTVCDKREPTVPRKLSSHHYSEPSGCFGRHPAPEAIETKNMRMNWQVHNTTHP